MLSSFGRLGSTTVHHEYKAAEVALYSSQLFIELKVMASRWHH